ncbi:hypothetical protein C942_02104 [Photobacterium marinum]|uniref:Uncharacterized protein n=1 Tax=Photobacterium marinum TaxID=1056511 RepID=L8J872_9GAMM|nr:hypothetical protein C942_02104 [Photobacterium marinum]
MKESQVCLALMMTCLVRIRCKARLLKTETGSLKKLPES